MNPDVETTQLGADIDSTGKNRGFRMVLKLRPLWAVAFGVAFGLTFIAAFTALVVGSIALHKLNNDSHNDNNSCTHLSELQASSVGDNLYKVKSGFCTPNVGQTINLYNPDCDVKDTIGRCTPTSAYKVATVNGNTFTLAFMNAESNIHTPMTTLPTFITGDTVASIHDPEFESYWPMDLLEPPIQADEIKSVVSTFEIFAVFPQVAMPKIDGTDDFTTNFISTYLGNEDDIFDRLNDIYDNSLAVIYNLAIGEYEKASHIANSILAAMVVKGYKVDKVDFADRIDEYKGLPARVRPDGYIDWELAGVLGDVTVDFDAGNNAFWGMAVCKLAAVKTEWRQVCKDHALMMHTKFRIPAGIAPEGADCEYDGYVGRLGSDSTRSDRTYISIEHQIDLNSMAKIILAHETALGLTAQDKTAFAEMRDTTAAFVNAMFDDTAEVFYIGTQECKNDNPGGINTADPFPTDGTTWNALAEAADNDKIQKALDKARTLFVTSDTFNTFSGCQPTGTPNLDKQYLFPCEQLMPELLLDGFRFSSKGLGIQWENAGSGAMAFTKYKIREAPTLVHSLKRMFSAWPSGILASFHEERYLRNSGIYNTGFTWSYFKKQHAASTYWSALAVLYAEAENELFNPYSTTVPEGLTGLDLAKIDTPKNFVIALDCSAITTSSYSVLGGSCDTDNIWNPSPDGVIRSLDVTCGFWNQPWFENGVSDYQCISLISTLNDLGIDTPGDIVSASSLADLCSNRLLKTCGPDRIIEITREIYHACSDNHALC